MRIRRWLLRALALILLVAGVLFLDHLFGAQVDAEFPVLISGRVVDQETGRPIAAAWVMALPRRELANDEEHISSWTRRLRDHSPISMWGGTRTKPDGSYSFLVKIPWGWSEGASGWSFSRKTPPPYYALGCLIVEAEGFKRTIIDPRSGQWNRGGNGDHFARLRVPQASAGRR